MTFSVKDKKQLMVLAGLLLVFAIATKDSFSRMKKSQQDRLKKTRLVKTFAATGVVSPAMTGAGVPEETPSAGATIDPFSGRPINFGTEGGVSAYKLSGIIYNPQAPSDSFVIINNRPYKMGEKIVNSEMKIVDINSREVTLTDGKATRILRTW